MKTLRCFSSCLERQCNEAVRITESKAEFILNSKSEWHQAPIVRVVPTSGLQAEQGELPAIVGRGRGSGGRGTGAGAWAGGRGAGLGARAGGDRRSRGAEERQSRRAQGS